MKQLKVRMNNDPEDLHLNEDSSSELCRHRVKHCGDLNAMGHNADCLYGCIMSRNRKTKVLPGQATVCVWPWFPAAGLLLLHLLLLLLPPSSWPRPAGAPAETAGNPHRPSPTLVSPIPGRQTPRIPAHDTQNRLFNNNIYDSSVVAL